MSAVQQQFPSAIHSAEVSVTSLFKSVAETQAVASSPSISNLDKARKAAGAEGLPAALRGGMLAGGQGCMWR